MEPAQLWGVLAAFLRILPVCVALVAFTRSWIGASVALSLGLALAWGLSQPLAPPLATLGVCLAWALRELCLGAIVALCLGLPLLALSWGARLAEQATGVFGARAGPVATLYGVAALFLALQLGLHRSLLIGLRESWSVAPPLAAGFQARAFALGIAGLVLEALALGLALGLPLLVSVLLLDASLTLVARLMGSRGTASWAPALKGPLLVWLISLLLMPALLEVPSALRLSMRNLRELTQSVGRQ
jgi:flagellar biosynthesis protein FliR